MLLAGALLLGSSSVPAQDMSNYPQANHWYGNAAPTLKGCKRTIQRRGVPGGASRGCLTADTRAVLSRLEARFGSVQVISTCRPGATIAGTRAPSYHRYGKAVDFNVPRGVSRAAVIQWLYANNRGLVMTYRNMGHIHFDTGAYHAIIHGGGGKVYRRARRR